MSKPSNLLVIWSDQHQARALSCAGHPVVQTPNLDQLAARGTRFTNAYTPSPICVPARASFATGRYAHDIRLWDNAMPYTGAPRGWGHALQDKGIRVESIGKLHYRDADDDTGFDVQHIPMHVVDGIGMVWGSIRKEDERVYYKDTRMMGDYIGPGESSYTRYDTAVTQRTCEWFADIDEQQEPWCLYVGLVAPHHPLVTPPEFFEMYPLDKLPPDKLHPRDGYQQHPWIAKVADALVGEEGWQNEEERLTAIAAYYGLTSWMDHNIGQIVKALQDSGLYDNTTVIYSSDHGENLGTRGLWGKFNLYEEAATVPLIVSPAPSLQQIPKSECATPVNLVDLAETIIDHFGAELPGERPGQSLYEIEQQAENPERVAFSEYHAVGAVSGAFMLRKGPWKLIEYVGFEPELFNLEDDPEELLDLAQTPEHSEVLAAMKTELRKVCDPEAMNELAFADQDALIEKYGGKASAAKLGAPSATPPPEV